MLVFFLAEGEAADHADQSCSQRAGQGGDAPAAWLGRLACELVKKVTDRLVDVHCNLPLSWFGEMKKYGGESKD
jgi:hypothetical protein